MALLSLKQVKSDTRLRRFRDTFRHHSVTELRNLGASNHPKRRTSASRSNGNIATLRVHTLVIVRADQASRPLFSVIKPMLAFLLTRLRVA